MRRFLTSEKPYQVEFKTNRNYFSEEAKADGVYKDHPYPFCLPRELAHENLFPEIREAILDYFKRKSIKWHDGQENKPSNHMCDSQVCCANFLFSFADKPDALATLLRPIYPTLGRMLPIEDELYVAFEWIGAENYLNEIKSPNRVRTRGANFTSADAAVFFRHRDGRKQIILIEWKYTEAYSSVSLEIAASGRKRTDIYQPLFDNGDCPLDKVKLPCYTSLFYEPFYQLMRQQFLANEMEKAHELGADIVSLLHISPDHNSDFKFVTSPKLQQMGKSPTEVWGKMVKTSDRFLAQSSESLFGRFDVAVHPELASWFKYVTARYRWVNQECP
jgi:hypothetical protein